MKGEKLVTSKDYFTAIFLGEFTNEEDFEAFLTGNDELFEQVQTKREYQQMIEEIKSTFEVFFMIDYVEPFNFKYKWQKEKASVKDFLKEITVLREHADNLLDSEKRYNCIILLYEYEYTGEKRSYQEKINFVEFYQNVSYRTTVDISRWVERVEKRKERK